MGYRLVNAGLWLYVGLIIFIFALHLCLQSAIKMFD